MIYKLFEDCVFVNNFQDKKFTEKSLRILKDQKKLNYKIKKSNVLGFQTKNLDDEYLSSKILNWSLSTLGDNLLFKKNFKLKLINLWINENSKYSYNQVHNHPNSHFSGVFYISVPNDSGDIYFLRPDFSSTINDLSNFLYASPTNIEQKTIKNYTNQFLLFPSSLMHGVHINKTNNCRISLSFNLFLAEN